MTVTKKIARYSGKPYFLVEDPLGIFGIMKSFSIGLGESGLDYVLGSYEFEINKDIVEIPLGGISICISHSSDNPGFGNYDLSRQIIFELRNFARLCNSDFVSYDNFRGTFGSYVGRRAGMSILRVEPRLFRLA